MTSYEQKTNFYFDSHTRALQMLCSACMNYSWAKQKFKNDDDPPVETENNTIIHSAVSTHTIEMLSHAISTTVKHNRCLVSTIKRNAVTVLKLEELFVDEALVKKTEKYHQGTKFLKESSVKSQSIVETDRPTVNSGLYYDEGRGLEKSREFISSVSSIFHVYFSSPEFWAYFSVSCLIQNKGFRIIVQRSISGFGD